MGTKVVDLIRDAMSEIGALASGETPTSTEAQDSFRALKRMLDSWANDALMIFTNATEKFDLTPGKQTYSMGPGGDFDTARPQSIEYLNSTLSDSPDLEAKVRILNQDEWASKSNKTFSGARPYEAIIEYTYPLAQITLWPIPSQSGSLTIVSQKPIVHFDSINDEVVLPPGYEEAIVYGLAVRLCGPFQRPVTPDLAQSATNAKAKLMRTNKQEKLLKTESFGGGSRASIYTGRSE